MPGNNLRITPVVLWRLGWRGAATLTRTPVAPMSGTLGGGRWDDPDGVYGLLYTTSEAEAAIAEVIRDFGMPSPGALNLLNAFVEQPDPEFDPPLDDLGVLDVLAELLENLELVELKIEKGTLCVDTTSKNVRTQLAIEFPREAEVLGIDGTAIAREALRTCMRRDITRPLGRELVEHWVTGGDADGIYYLSSLNESWECWALIATPGEQPACIEQVRTGGVLIPTDPRVQAALATLAN